MITRWQGKTDDVRIESLLSSIKGELAFDIGANIGMTAHRFSLNFKTVVAFEPCQESYEILAREAPPNVIASQRAVSDSDGEIELQEAMRSIQTGQLVSKPGLHWGAITSSRKVKSTTLEKAVAIYGNPDFVKIDTEGHEVEVVRGGLEYLQKHQPRLCIEVHHGHHEPEIRKLLPFVDLETIRQDKFRKESMIYRNHMWMVTSGLL